LAWDVQLIVVGRADAAVGVAVFELHAASGAELPAWEPGAHIDLLLDGQFVRQYSLCGDPADRACWRIAVLHETRGRGGSAWLHERLRPGSRVSAAGPRNNFRLEPAPRYTFIAGGIGITPILPMIRQAQRTGIPWSLHYGGRSLASMAFREELAAHGPAVEIVPDDREGLLDLARIMAGSAPGTVVYCCGPASLLDAAGEAAAASRLAFRAERFTPAPAGDTGPAGDRSFEVHLEQTGVTLTVPPGRSILEVVEEAGVFVISSCREGTCGSCETRVLDGTPDHRDSLLSRDVTDAMLICVSRAACPRLTLDL
jgi:ferredoxin-NADP reductase